MSARPPRRLAVGQPIVRRSTGSAQDFHDQSVPTTGRPEIWFHRPASPALVLGSTQSDAVLDLASARAAGWEVARRRSGGGLVVVQPDAGLWVDVIVPRSHPRWDEDVNRAFHWLGDAWLEALLPFTGPAGLSAAIHTGPMLNASAGRSYCFAGRGPGEVLVGDASGRPGTSKVVGISQRRARGVARFQCLALLRHDPRPALAFTASAHRESMAAAVSRTRAGWPSMTSPPALETLTASVERALCAALSGDHPAGR